MGSDFSNLFARTLTTYNFTHWKDHKETRINTEMLKQLNVINLGKFEFEPSGKLIKPSPLYESSCLKIILGVVFCRMQDEELMLILNSTLQSFLLNYEKLPIYVLKACLLFLK